MTLAAIALAFKLILENFPIWAATEYFSSSQLSSIAETQKGF
jgi:hypothetical protein